MKRRLPFFLLAGLLVVLGGLVANGFIVYDRLHRYVDHLSIERDGKTLLWASGQTWDESKWFDVTDALVDTSTFNHALGVDRISSIDEPLFVLSDDPKLAEFGITDEAFTIGYAEGDEAKAYPTHVLNRHELVNDWLRGKPITVGW